MGSTRKRRAFPIQRCIFSIGTHHSSFIIKASFDPFFVYCPANSLSKLHSQFWQCPLEWRHFPCWNWSLASRQYNASMVTFKVRINFLSVCGSAILSVRLIHVIASAWRYRLIIISTNISTDFSSITFLQLNNVHDFMILKCRLTWMLMYLTHTPAHGATFVPLLKPGRTQNPSSYFSVVLLNTNQFCMFCNA